MWLLCCEVLFTKLNLFSPNCQVHYDGFQPENAPSEVMCKLYSFFTLLEENRAAILILAFLFCQCWNSFTKYLNGGIAVCHGKKICIFPYKSTLILDSTSYFLLLAVFHTKDAMYIYPGLVLTAQFIPCTNDVPSLAWCIFYF